MTENKTLNGNKNAFLPIKRFSCLTLLCSIFVLSACGKYSIPGFSPEERKKRKEVTELRKELKDLESKKIAAKNLKNPFSTKLKSDKKRIDRLERAVQQMRNEFNSVKPSITRLSGLENEIQTLIQELQTLNETGNVPVAPQRLAPRQKIMAEQPHMAPKKVQPRKITTKSSYQKKSPPPVSNGKATIYDLRIGEHPNRTRIVMDTNSKTGFNVDIDNNEKIAVIDLPQAGWSAAKSKSLAKSNFVSSYSVESSEEGHILILQLKRNAKVTYKGDLKGSSGSARRLVLDLSGA